MKLKSPFFLPIFILSNFFFFSLFIPFYSTSLRSTDGFQFNSTEKIIFLIISSHLILQSCNQFILTYFNLNVNRHRYTSLQFSPLPRSINFPLPGYHLLHALQICPTRCHVSKTDRIVAVSRPKDITVEDEIRFREIFNTKRSITSEKLATIVIIHERDSYESKIFWRSS